MKPDELELVGGEHLDGVALNDGWWWGAVVDPTSRVRMSGLGFFPDVCTAATNTVTVDGDRDRGVRARIRNKTPPLSMASQAYIDAIDVAEEKETLRNELAALRELAVAHEKAQLVLNRKRLS